MNKLTGFENKMFFLRRECDLSNRIGSFLRAYWIEILNLKLE